MNPQDMTVILLSGGESSRFWPLSHKMLMTYLGRTFLDQQIEMLLGFGFTDLVVVVNDEINKRLAGEKFKKVLQQGKGQAAAILSAKDLLGEKPILVLNADDIVETSLFSKIVNAAADKNLQVGYKTDTYFPGGYLELRGKQITRIVEKPGAGNEPSEYVDLVCDYFPNPSELLEYLKKTTEHDPISAYEETKSMMMQANIPFEMVEYNETWIPVKYPWHTLSAMEYYLGTIKEQHIAKSASVHPSATLSGPIILEENVRVMEYAKLVGPLYVGAGTIIGNHTIVRYSLIGENSVVGFSSDVTRSYIGSNTWLHSNYVGDSVLSNDIGMGAGAVLANFRLDEGDVHSLVKGEKINTQRNKFGAILGEGARIGVGAHLMPGTKVGKNSVVGPGVILQTDLADNKRCYIKQEHTITDNFSSNIKNRDQLRKKI